MKTPAKLVLYCIASTDTMLGPFLFIDTRYRSTLFYVKVAVGAKKAQGLKTQNFELLELELVEDTHHNEEERLKDDEK
jgi:hypothetical protein